MHSGIPITKTKPLSYFLKIFEYALVLNFIATPISSALAETQSVSCSAMLSNIQLSGNQVSREEYLRGHSLEMIIFDCKYHEAQANVMIFDAHIRSGLAARSALATQAGKRYEQAAETDLLATVLLANGRLIAIGWLFPVPWLITQF